MYTKIHGGQMINGSGRPNFVHVGHTDNEAYNTDSPAAYVINMQFCGIRAETCRITLLFWRQMTLTCCHFFPDRKCRHLGFQNGRQESPFSQFISETTADSNTIPMLTLRFSGMTNQMAVFKIRSNVRHIGFQDGCQNFKFGRYLRIYRR